MTLTEMLRVRNINHNETASLPQLASALSEHGATKYELMLGFQCSVHVTDVARTGQR
jgi:hypothetical protein